MLQLFLLLQCVKGICTSYYHRSPVLLCSALLHPGSPKMSQHSSHPRNETLLLFEQLLVFDTIIIDQPNKGSQLWIKEGVLKKRRKLFRATLGLQLGALSQEVLKANCNTLKVLFTFPQKHCICSFSPISFAQLIKAWFSFLFLQGQGTKSLC